MSKWKNEDEMFALMREKLYTPVVGDILDQKGYVHQFLPPDIRPLKDDMKLAGKAMTVLMIDVFGEQKKPFGSSPRLSISFRRMRYISRPAAQSAALIGASCSPPLPAPAARSARCSTAGTEIPRRSSHRTGRCSAAAAMRRIPVCVPRWCSSAARSKLVR